MRKQHNFFKNIDKTTVILFIIMVFMGWFNIFAAEITEEHSNIFDISQNYGKQLLWVISALLFGTVILMIDVKIFPAFAYLIYAFFLIVLIGVLLFGVEINASKSWFRVGGFAIQPAEFAKYATALALSKYLADIKSKNPSFSTLLTALIIIGIPILLIFLQNDTGTALVFAAFTMVLYREGYISGLILIVGVTAVFLFVLTLLVSEFLIIGLLAFVTLALAYRIRRRKRELIQLMGLFAVMALYVYFVDYTYTNVLQPHQKARIEVLIDENVDRRGIGYNLHQSKIAIGSGGFWGKGYLKGTQTKYNFVPEQGTDFIFCTVGEEWGFVGSSAIVILFVMLIVRVIGMAERQKSNFSRIFGYSVASIIFFHFFVNVGMTMGLVPIIGIPLPFFSYGGSSLWGFTLMLFTFIKLDSKRLDLL